MGTKLRALYQRKKGRDLFDLHYAGQSAKLDYDKIIRCYNEYMKFAVGKVPTQKEFSKNMLEKKDSPLFLGDMEGLLKPSTTYNQEEAFDNLSDQLIDLMK